MTKIILAMLLGAVCASSWWAISLWPKIEALYIPLAVSTVCVILWTLAESLDIDN